MQPAATTVDQEEAPKPESPVEEQVAPAFSFMASAAPTTTIAPKEAQATAPAFSFMASAQAETATTEDAPSTAPAAAFSFMAQAQGEAPKEDESKDQGASGFNFI